MTAIFYGAARRAANLFARRARAANAVVALISRRRVLFAGGRARAYGVGVAALRAAIFCGAVAANTGAGRARAAAEGGMTAAAFLRGAAG